MAGAVEIAYLVARQAAATNENSTNDLTGTPGHCDSSNAYDGKLGLRISAIFVILIGSTCGATFPVFARRHKGLGIPDWTFFVAKYFGSGVIIATAFIHLLAPANDALTDPCLTGPITEYAWAEGIALITVMVMFFLELMTMRYGNFGDHDHDPTVTDHHNDSNHDELDVENRKQYGTVERAPSTHHTPGDDHLGHAREHIDNADVDPHWTERGILPETYSAQLTAIFILEFGVIFHSIFIGLTLAVSGAEFKTLYVVLVFHQTFEGLGLGSRLSSVPWPKSKRWTPYLLAIGDRKSVV